MFLSNKTLNQAFSELQEAHATRKAGLEKTTALFRFIAFDMLSKKNGSSEIDFQPDKEDENRKNLIREYDQICVEGQKSISNLGFLCNDGRLGAERVGNDFLTTQLKSASMRKNQGGISYPSRPDAPILQIGCGPKYWSIKKAKNWDKNILEFLHDRKTSSPFLCLLIVILRKYDFPGANMGGAVDALLDKAKECFTEEFVQFMKSKITKEEQTINITWQDKPPEIMLQGLASHGLNESTKLTELVDAFVGDMQSVGLRVSKSLSLRFISSLLSKRFLILTGLAGSGKTRLAQALARWLTFSCMAEDVFAPGSEIKSANVTYYVKNSDSLSVEFWNSPNEKEATKVILPREMIAEWASFIQNNSISQATPARDIREAVKHASKFSDQLHSFETHLKAAAFALVNNRAEKTSGVCYAVVPVGADWTGNENIIGYPDGLQPAQYVAKPALDLILHAETYEHIPHFLILDEMNLSHVERYFADLLSVMESDEGLELYPGDTDKPDTWRKTSAAKRVRPKVPQLPKNLFIIGTVNVDETTYMFSPKVLDRANVIEFRMNSEELGGFLGNPAKPDLSNLEGKGTPFGKEFVDAAKNPVTVPVDARAIYEAEMLLLFNTLQGHGAEFGYRTVYETARFLHFYKILGNYADGSVNWIPEAIDSVIFQKLLPKLHGSRAKLGPVLKKLWFLCANGVDSRGTDVLKAAEEAARSVDKKAEPSVIVPVGAAYPFSAEKIGRMWRGG